MSGFVVGEVNELHAVPFQRYIVESDAIAQVSLAVAPHTAFIVAAVPVFVVVQTFSLQ
jgi:hypothetical protein